MKLMQRNVEDAAAIRILSRPQDQAGDAADYAYRHILRRIREARATIEIHMYVWRADAVGHLVGQAVLEAAERGVRVTVFKDSGAALFEGQESNRKPFFRTEQPLLRRVSQRLVGMTLPDSRVRDDWDQTMGERLRAHPNVDFHWVSPTHTKYYCIDERYVITGSLNLEDRHRGYHDVMAEISGEEAVRVFREAQRTSLATDSDGALSVLVNLPEKGAFPIKSAVLRLIEDARMSIHIEMAYIGEEDITRALVAASNRGVRLSILFSAKANIGNDANYHTLRRMMEQTAIDVRISDKMIHSKLMVVDDMKAVLGSANFSIFSMQRAGELCLLSKNDTPLLRQLLPIVEARWALGRPMRDVRSLPPYSRILARLQQWHQRVCSHK